MKKRILAVFLLAVTLFALCSCAVNRGAIQEYYFDRAVIHPDFPMHNTLETLSTDVYEETFLKLFDDGRWVIDMPIGLIFDGNIEKGTYTEKEGLYFFEGFDDSSSSVVGRKTVDGFIIEFYMTTAQGPAVYETLYFVNFAYAE